MVVSSPLPEPVGKTFHRRKAILDALKSQLQAIDGANGYNYEISSTSVLTSHTEAINFADRPMILIKQGQETVEDLANGAMDRTLEVILETWLLIDSTANAQISEILNAWSFDLEATILKDRTLGGTALDCNIVSSESYSDVERLPDAGLLLELSIRYRTSELNPSSASPGASSPVS
tara:strand:+ start:1245 stop:1775 length:531 start_codon:yes stop_codon:yes gene_type:complete